MPSTLAAAPVTPRQSVSADTRLAVFGRDSFQCLACGSRQELNVDHVVPLAAGGSNHEGNYQTLCATCNSIKGAEPLKLWEVRERRYQKLRASFGSAMRADLPPAQLSARMRKFNSHELVRLHDDIAGRILKLTSPEALAEEADRLRAQRLSELASQRAFYDRAFDAPPTCGFAQKAYAATDPSVAQASAAAYAAMFAEANVQRALTQARAEERRARWLISERLREARSQVAEMQEHLSACERILA